MFHKVVFMFPHCCLSPFPFSVVLVDTPHATMGAPRICYFAILHFSVIRHLVCIVVKYRLIFGPLLLPTHNLFLEFNGSGGEADPFTSESVDG